MKKLHNNLSLIGGMLLAMSATVNAQWTETGSAVYLNSTTKNVGIGTTTPAFALDLVRSGSANLSLKSTSGTSNLLLDRANSSATSSVSYRTNGVGKWQTGTVGTDNFAIRNIGLGNSAFVVLAANNNVGIGFPNPEAKLHINGALDVGGTQTTHQQGAWLEWNKVSGQGKTYLLNQKGLGIGGFVFGEVSTSDSITERMSIDNVGNVGINTSSPVSKLHIVQAGNYAANDWAQHGLAIWSQADGFGMKLQMGADPNNNISYIQSVLGNVLAYPLVLNPNGANVGIGTGSPNAKLNVAGGLISLDANKYITTRPTDNFTFDSKTVGHYSLGWYNDSWSSAFGDAAWLSAYGGIRFFTFGTERMSLDASGNLYINGNSFAGAKFGVQADQVAISGKVNNNFSQAVTGIANGGANAYAIYGVSTAGYAGYFVGNVYTTGAYLPSDEKLKENIAPMQNALDKVMKLEVKTYNFKTAEFPQMNLPAMKQNGFIAQNLEKVFPELIRNNEENNSIGQTAFKSVNYIGMIPVLTEAIQEQQKQLEAKDTKIAELENKLNNMQLCVESLCNASAAQKASSVEPQVLGNLLQNTPNPFNQTTVIRYALNSENTSGKIIIRDLSGNLVKQVNIANSGKGQVTINANELSAGTYTYTLEIAGASVDTKLMVVTK